MTEQMNEKEIATLCEQARNDWLNFRNSVFDFLEKPETDPNSPQLIGLFTHNTRMNSTMLQLEEAFNMEPMIQASGISGTKQVSPEEPDAQDLGAEPKETFDEHQEEMAQEAGMGLGIDAYNDAKGQSVTSDDPDNLPT